MHIGLQPAYIYDVDRNMVYVFDGVTKVQHSLSIKMEDTQSTKTGAAYVNNAKNEPSEVTLEVLMSNVYSDTGDLTSRNADRAMAALDVLTELKSSRRKVRVITQYATYNDMMLKSISVVQDESSQSGWTGQITFRECLRTATNRRGVSISSTADATGGRTPSVLVYWFGENAI